MGTAMDLLVLFITHTLAQYPPWTSFLLLLHTVHCLRRLGECLFVHEFSPDAKMPLHLWIAGVAHYVLTPWSLVPACASNTVSWWSLLSMTSPTTPTPSSSSSSSPSSSSINAAGIPSLQDDDVALLALSNPVVLLRGIAAMFFGLTLFTGGSILQHLVHRQLAALRSSSSSKKKRNSNERSDRQNDDDDVASGGSSSGMLPSAQRRRNAMNINYNISSGNGEDDSQDGVELQASSTTTPSSSSSSSATTTSTYPLPKGDLFDVVICPHYTAEIVIYIGLYIIQLGASTVFGMGKGEYAAVCSPRNIVSTSSASSSTTTPSSSSLFLPLSPTMIQILTVPSSLLLVLWVIANLLVTGARTRAWYIQTYPQEPRVKYTAAVIPYLF
jgi:hypothetical protein